MGKQTAINIVSGWLIAITVSVKCFIWMRDLRRAGMIHDLFLYDWHTHAAQTGERFHGLKHPEKAYRNAKKYFPLNQIEVDIIRTHMCR